MPNKDLELLCDPQQHTLPEAIKLARQLNDRHPLLDIELAQLTPPRTGEKGVHLEGSKVERALEILDAISKGNRILNRLIHLIENDNERIRSKAALLIGRRVGSTHWAKKAEHDQNHRVRASVIEALWDSPLPQCRDIFNRALRDSDHRVVGNAIYGIYRICLADGIQLLTDMAAHGTVGRRITAAWVMGKTEDWQFHILLQTMIRDKETRVRSIALKSMFRLKRARDAAGARFGPRC